MHGVIVLCDCKFLRHESSRAALLPCTSLSVHRSYARFRGITYYPYRFVFMFGIDGCNDWCFAANSFDHIKTPLVNRSPMEGRPILRHCQERSGIVRDVRQEVG